MIGQNRLKNGQFKYKLDLLNQRCFGWNIRVTVIWKSLRPIEADRFFEKAAEFNFLEDLLDDERNERKAEYSDCFDVEDEDEDDY